MTRKSIKARKHANVKNRIRTLRNQARAQRMKRLAEKRLKTIQIRSFGVEGLDELNRKLRKLEKFYDASNVEKQADISIYTAFLTTAFQRAATKKLQDEYMEDYPEIFDGELATTDPFEYISNLRELLDEISESFDTTNDEDKQIILDMQAQLFLDAASEAGKEFDTLGLTKKNTAINALANIFGGLSV